MEIRFNIESHQLGETVGEIFKNLSDDEKKTIAFNIVSQWLKEPHDGERKNYGNQLVQDYLSGKIHMDSYDKERFKTEEQIRNWYNFRDKLSKFRSTREIMIEQITNSTIQYYKENILSLVKEDPQINELYEKAKEEIVKDFPRFIQAALTQYFISQMSNLTSVLQIENNMNYNLGELKNKLNQLNTGIQF